MYVLCVFGHRFREFLELANENVMYEINLTLKTCKRIPMQRKWHAYGIPSNATFESEYYIGGPGEEVFAQEWSDRIPLRRRECPLAWAWPSLTADTPRPDC